MLGQIRKGERATSGLRSDRFFSIASDWYFTTREGAAIGPFKAKTDAEKGMSDFIDFLAVAEPVVRSSFIDSLSRIES